MGRVEVVGTGTGIGIGIGMGDGRWEVVGGLCIGAVVFVVVVVVVVVVFLGCSSVSRHQASVLYMEVNYRQIFDWLSFEAVVFWK